MPWDGLPMDAPNGKRMSLAAALRQEFPGVVEVEASVAKGRAYLAERDVGGAVRPRYLLLDRDPFDAAWVIHKSLDIEESPVRWPGVVAAALTTWEQ